MFMYASQYNTQKACSQTDTLSSIQGMCTKSTYSVNVHVETDVLQGNPTATDQAFWEEKSHYLNLNVEQKVLSKRQGKSRHPCRPYRTEHKTDETEECSG